MPAVPMKAIVVTVGEEQESGYPVSLAAWDHEAGSTGSPLGSGTLPPGWWSELRQSYPLATLDEWTQNAPQVADRLGALLADCRQVGNLLHTCDGCTTNGYRMHPHLRVYLSIPPSLSEVPWELVRINDRFVFRERGHLCLRGTPVPGRQAPADDANPAADRLPIDVLIVVGELDDLDTLRAKRETEAVFQLVNSYPAAWRVRVLEQPAWARIKRELERKVPDILHVVGHSAWAGGQRALMVNAEDEWELGPEQINRLFTAGWPRLLLLNTCASAEMIPDLMQANAAGTVIGMQGQIDVDAAECFAGKFYTALIRGADVSLAMEKARDELRAQRSRDDSAWAIPVLVLGRGAAREQVRAGLHELNRRYEQIVPDDQLPSRKPPIDRVIEDRTLHDGGWLTGLVGRQNTGKTFLVKRFLTSCKVNNDLTVYHSFGAHPDPRVDQRRGLAAAAHTAVAQLIAESCDRGVVGDFETLAADLENLEAEPLEMTDAVARLADCMDHAAQRAGRPLILVLDGVDRLSGHSGDDSYTFVEAVLKQHLRHEADRAASTRSRLIVVADEAPDDAESGAHGIRRWKDRGVSVVELGSYRSDEYTIIGREACARYGRGPDGIEGYLSKMSGTGGRLYPADLVKLIEDLYPDLRQTSR